MATSFTPLIATLDGETTNAEALRRAVQEKGLAYVFAHEACPSDAAVQHLASAKEKLLRILMSGRRSFFCFVCSKEQRKRFSIEEAQRRVTLPHLPGAIIGCLEELYANSAEEFAERFAERFTSSAGKIPVLFFTESFYNSFKQMTDILLKNESGELPEEGEMSSSG